MSASAYVYILANGFKKLYIGITNDLELRVTQHRSKKNPLSHTSRYNINQLVYYERFTSISAAIHREKVLKGWLRIRKLDLIISTNPTWRDLSTDWGRPTAPFDERAFEARQAPEASYPDPSSSPKPPSS
jgi:putative endonuclease